MFFRITVRLIAFWKNNVDELQLITSTDYVLIKSSKEITSIEYENEALHDDLDFKVNLLHYEQTKNKHTSFMVRKRQ